MAKYGKNNYFDGVILPEPKEEMLRRMAKGVNCTKGYLQSLDAGLLFEGSRTLECFFTYVPSDKMQIIAGFSSSMMEISVVSSEIRFYCGGAYKSTVVVPGNNYLVDIAYDGTTAICYLNGAEAARFPVTGYKVTDIFRTGSNTYIPQGSIVFCRHYNYAISAKEVAAHYNDGDPAGYVLPNAMKELTPVEIVGKNSYTWTGVDDPVSFVIKINRVLSVGGAFRITGSVSNYKSGTPYLNLGHGSIAYLPKDNSPFTLVVTLKGGSSTLLPYIYIYGGSSSEDKQLTITVDSIEPVGCVAEYLPQNLIPTAEGSVVQWLDSAPQLPEANGILPPLDASVGGYDLAAIGNPKIII